MAKESGGQESEAEVRRRRLEALGALAREQQGAGAAAPVPATPGAPLAPRSAVHGAERPAIPAPTATGGRGSRRAWRWAALGAGALAVVVIAVVVLRAVFAPAPPRHAAANTVTLDLGKSDITCPNAVAWSPDGSQVAIVGHASATCPSPFDAKYTAAALGVYNATTGKLARLIQPDDAIEPALPLVFPTGTGTPAGVSDSTIQAISGAPQRTITYQGIAWSPDGSRLALPFSVVALITTQQGNQTSESDEVIANGVEVLRPGDTTSKPQVLVNTSAPDTNDVWELQTSAGTALTALFGTVFDGDMPPAVGYHWGASGKLAADAPFSGPTPAAPPLGPVGNPAGGASFTPWQPGTATYLNGGYVNGVPTTENAGAYLTFTTITAWSPDGRYVVVCHVDERVQPAGITAPNAQALKDMQLDQMPVAPVRDKALNAVLTALLPQDQQGRQVQLAWRPDGRVLAARQWPLQGEAAGPVHLYDTTTGAPLATLTPASKKGFIFQGDFDVVWSPDGSHLLAMDAASGLVTIWGPSALPK